MPKSHADDESPTYPENTLLGVLDTPEQVRCALEAPSGRTVLLDKALRVVQSFDMWNDELEVKAQYEEALREGHIVVRVEALRRCGGHFISYFGKLTRERIAPWTTARGPGSATPLK